ncbi:MAG: glutamate racemase, partial [Rothia dentocariosa]
LTENIENPDLETNPHHEFLATGESEIFENLARRFLGPEVHNVRHTASVAERFPTGSLAALPTQTASKDLNPEEASGLPSVTIDSSLAAFTHTE